MSYWRRPRDVQWRKAMFQLHLWSGVILGLYFVVVCLTGSLVVYKKELERWAIPDLIHVTPTGDYQSLARMVTLVRSRYPDHRLQNAYLYFVPGTSWSFRFLGPRGRVQVYVDPYRTTILGEDSYQGKFLQWVYDLHRDLLLGTPGLRINAWGGWLLTLMCLSGVVVWWPGVGRLRNALTYVRGGWRRQNYDVHKLVGLWSAVLLAGVAFLGAYWGYQPQYEQALAWATGGPAKRLAPRITRTDGVTEADIDAVYAAARAAMPEGTPTLFTVAGAPDLPHSLHHRLPDDWRTQGDNVVYVHPQTAAVIRTDYHHTLPLGVRLQRDIFALHFGTFWGHPTRLLWVVLGLTPLVLFVTGMLMWWNRSLRHRVSRPRGSVATSGR